MSADLAYQTDRPLVEEVLRLREELQDLECLRANQLAAISTLAMANTPVSLAACRIPKDHVCYTAAYQDVLRAIDREITLRNRCEHLEKESLRLRLRVRELEGGEYCPCCGIDKNRLLRFHANRLP